MNILIAGVGGQGTLLASRILGRVAQDGGYDVKVSEVHGMAQRGGSVVTYVKYGEKIYSPIIEEGEADIVLAFEELEAYRYLPYLKKGGKLLMNTQCTDPMPVITGKMEYPADIIGKIEAMGVDLTAVDALSLAREAGSEKAVNVVLIGVLAAHTDISESEWLSAIERTVPPKFLEINRKAFSLGYNQ
ncbi:MAG: indolepyruvate oxidoreductase subunit beta [Ruminococcaceae bacterium]|nr:indolepyruvate oxidoreductase subunit beta [Oscillospiraceae bacterium]